MAAKIEVTDGTDDPEREGDSGGLWWWRFVGGNGQTEAFSETFAGATPGRSRHGALRAARRFAGRCGVTVKVWNPETRKWEADAR